MDPLNHIQCNIKSKGNTQMERTAKAHWLGDFKDGKGTLTTESGVLNETAYSYKTRFEEGVKGTNPEELLAAAHAGCFTMQVAAVLTKKGINPKTLDTKANVTLEGLSITKVHLSITGSISGLNSAVFSDIVQDAAKHCLVSKILNIPVTCESHLLT